MERKGYLVINKDIANIDGNNKVSKILVYSFIKSWKKQNTEYLDIDTHYLSDITYKQTEEQLNMKVNRIIPELIKDGVFEVVHKKYKGAEERNLYTFKEETNYYFIHNAFFENTTKENNKLKGFMLLLKCHCINGTNIYHSYKPIKGKYNATELANLLCIDKKTLQKYIKECLALKWLALIDGGILITHPFIKADIIKENDRLTFLYDTIYNFCLSKGTIPPKREDDILKKIYYHYPTNKDEYNMYLESGIKCTDYLPIALNKRLSNLPKEVNWQYILTALTNKEIKRKVCNLIIID